MATRKGRRGAQRLLLLAWCASLALAAALPTFRQCRTCAVCEVSEEGGGEGEENALPACERCTGCTHTLRPLDRTRTVRGREVTMHPGATGASVFEATEAGGRAAILKLRRSKLFRENVFDVHELPVALGIPSLAQECGLGEVDAALWEAPLRAYTPGEGGEKLDLPHVVFEETAAGISVERLIIHYTPQVAAEVIARIPHERWLQAALFDLLFLQRDRHNENIFVTDSGGMRLIDTRDGVLADVLDSVFFPRTYYYTRNRFGFDHLRACSGTPTHQHQSILGMDYRCHAPEGGLGEALPPAFAACVRRFAGMSAEELARAYFREEEAREGHAPEAVKHMRKAAARLREQARLLAEYGLEGALERTEHNNSTGMVPAFVGYPLLPPVCSLTGRLGQPGQTPRDLPRCSEE